MSNVWHPFTQMRDFAAESAPSIERAEGFLLVDTDGRRYIDGVSSLWCNVHGHRHPRIDEAIRSQLERVAHTTMLGLTHPAGEELARRLADLAPAPPRGDDRPALSRVFFSDSGSTAVEVALKMAFQYWQQSSEARPSRTGFVSLEDGYHGDTIGSVSVGGIDLFHSLYRPLLFESHKIPPGDPDTLARVLAEHDDEVAAVVLAPPFFGAAGIPVPPHG